MLVTDTIAITGAAGFIGSYLVGYLNQLGFERLLLVDDFSHDDKMRNLEGKKYLRHIDRNEFVQWANDNPGSFQHIFHLGARTDTTEMDYSVHKKWNLDYSKEIWAICTQQHISLVYASSAATYGNGELGYKDDHDIVEDLQPLNPYGKSKNDFDIWALQQQDAPPFWAGVKFFNVYGPNEYHKGRMASVIFHAFNQVQEKGEVKLFRSHNPNYGDGGQLRDFVYVRDVVNICFWLMQNQPENGLYNSGTGQARTFLDLANGIFSALGKEPNIQFIDTPEDIRNKYQYFTQADMSKILTAGYDSRFYSLEEGIEEYVSQYLKKASYF